MTMINFSEAMSVIKKYQESTPVHVIPIANDLGVKVFRVTGWPDDISGKITKGDDGAYSIYVNEDHPYTRRRFTIAHELAHSILHNYAIGDGIIDDGLYRSGLSNKMESEANALAADILMPMKLIKYHQDQGADNIIELASIFEVSPSAMSIRLGVPFETEVQQVNIARVAG